MAVIFKVVLEKSYENFEIRPCYTDGYLVSNEKSLLLPTAYPSKKM